MVNEPKFQETEKIIKKMKKGISVSSLELEQYNRFMPELNESLQNLSTSVDTIKII